MCLNTVFVPFAHCLIRGLSHHMLNIEHCYIRAVVVCFRFASRCHTCCCVGGFTDLYPAGRGNVVSVQEELWAFSAAPYTRQCLLQANGLTGYRIGRKRSHHRPGGFLGGIAVTCFLLKVSAILPRALLPFHRQVWMPRGTAKL